MLKTEHVTTKNQPADLLTKGLGRVQHNILLNKLGMKSVFQPQAWGGVLENRVNYKFMVCVTNS